jgi:hypothetical protein
VNLGKARCWRAFPMCCLYPVSAAEHSLDSASGCGQRRRLTSRNRNPGLPLQCVAVRVENRNAGLVELAPGSRGRVAVAQLAEVEREIRSRLISQFA